MPFWKAPFVNAFGGICLALALSMVIVPLAPAGGRRWLWTGGLLPATPGAGTPFALFLRDADGALKDKPRWARR